MSTVVLDFKLPAELDAAAATAFASGDTMTIQKSGESYQRPFAPATLFAGLNVTYVSGSHYGLQGRSGTTGSFTDSVWNIDYQGYNATYGWMFKAWGWAEDCGYIRTTEHFTASNPAALGTAAKGTSEFMARGDHVHPTTGLAPAGGDLAVDWLCKDLRSATGYLYHQASGGSNVGNIDLYDTGVSNAMVFRNGAGYYFFGLTGTTAASVYVGPLQTRTILPEAHETYNLGVTGTRWNRGWFHELYGTHDISVDSDQRLKAGIADSDLGLDFVLALRPVRYQMAVRDWERDEEGRPRRDRPLPGIRPHYGFLAQEVRSAMGARDFGGYVDIDQTGEQLGLRYGQFIAPLVKAVQELHGQVQEERQARLALEQRLAVLEMALWPSGASRAKV